MLLTEKSTIKKYTKLQIKRMLEWDECLANEIYIPVGEEYEIEVEKNCLKNENYFLFGGFVDKKIVAIFSFHLSKSHCTRIDGVLVAKDQRNKGYGKEIVGFVIDIFKERKYENVFLWPANDTAEHIYFVAGFRVQFEEEAGSAIYCQ